MVNIGFDCEVVLEADRFRKYKFLSPSISYILGVVVAFFLRKLGTKMKIILDDGSVIEETLSLTAIGNGKFCGGGFQSCPLASLTDGLLDITIIKKVSRLNFIQLIGCYQDGTFLVKKNSQKFFKYIRTNRFRMEFENEKSICIDGEIFHGKTVNFEVIPGGFNFVVPKGSQLLYTGMEK
jgi:diacylglycerol kinase family enzyme